MRFSIPCQFLICSISKYVHLLRSLKAQTANYLCENYLKSQCFFFKNRSRSLSLSLTPEGSVCGSVPFLTRLQLVQMLIKNRAPKHCSLYLSIYLPVSILSIYLSKCLSTSRRGTCWRSSLTRRTPTCTASWGSSGAWPGSAATPVL